MADPIRRAIARYWDGRASTYDAVGLHTPATDAERRAWTRVRNLLAPAGRTIDVLDVGCGTGFLSLLFAEAGHRCMGCDVAPAMIAEARRRAATGALPASFLLADAECLPLAGHAVDLVVSRQLFWTLPHSAQALREWVRVTRPGGHVAIIDDQWIPEPRGGHGWDPYERELVGALPYLHGGAAAEEVAALLEGAGLEHIVMDLMEDRMAAEQAWLEAAGRTSSLSARYLVYGSRVR